MTGTLTASWARRKPPARPSRPCVRRPAGYLWDHEPVQLTGFRERPAGLLKQGSSLFTTSADSGVAQVGVAGVGGRGTLTGGTLEGSNVDLGQEFTNMIIAQRGFEADHVGS